MKLTPLFRFLALVALALGPSTLSFGQGTAFTYQGRLNNHGSPANGSFDLQFTLFATNLAGTALAGPVTNQAVPVSSGLFTASVDFGNAFPGPSTTTWLELAVSTNAANTFSTLTPRQQLLPVPYAIFANTASNLVGNLPAAQLTGILPLAQLPPEVLTNTQTSATLSGTFTGNGAGLTNNTPLAALGPYSVPGSNAVAAMIIALAPGGPGGAATNTIAVNNGVGNNTTFNPNSGSANVAVTVNGTQVFGVATNQPMLITQIGYETNINGTAWNEWSAGSTFSSVFDPIRVEGFNLAANGGVVVGAQQGIGDVWEYNFYVGAGMDEIMMERHWDVWATNGTGYRILQADADINANHGGTNDYFNLASEIFTFELPYSGTPFAQLSPTSFFLYNPTGTEGICINENGTGQVYLLPVNISAAQDLELGNGTGNGAWGTFNVFTKSSGSFTLNNNGATYTSTGNAFYTINSGFISQAPNSSDAAVSSFEMDDTSPYSGARNWFVGNTGVRTDYGAHEGALTWNMSSTAGGDTRTSAGAVQYSLWDTNRTTWSQPTAFTNAGTGASTVIASNTITTGTIEATNFTGNGGGLTHLNASQISGTLPVANLPGLTTNVSNGGITFHITNGLIMRITTP